MQKLQLLEFLSCRRVLGGYFIITFSATSTNLSLIILLRICQEAEWGRIQNIPLLYNNCFCWAEVTMLWLD